MKNAILLRSRMTRNRHVRFWSRVRRGDLLGLDNNNTFWIPQIEGTKISVEIPGVLDEVISFADLNNLDVVIKIGIEKDKSGAYPDKNRVLTIITPDQVSYAEFMSNQGVAWGL